MRKILLVLLLFTPSHNYSEVQSTIMLPPLLIEGAVPDRADSSKIYFVWQTVQAVTGIKKYLPPYIWFAKFGNSKPPEWKVVWMQMHPEYAAEVQTKYYLAYSFPGTNRIQAAPHLFAGTNGDLGLGYYVLGHEMMHYLIDESVPVAEQHCYFKEHNYNKLLIEVLVAENIAHPVLGRPSRFTMGDGCPEK